MTQLATLNFVLLIATSVVTAAAGVFVWLRLRTPGARVLSLMLLACALNSGAFGLEFATTSLATKVALEKLLVVSAATIPTLWLVFSLQYTGRGRFVTRSVIALLAVVPLTSVLMAVSNDSHHLFWRAVTLASGDAYLAAKLTFGPAYWVHIAYTNVLLAAGTVVLLHLFWRSWNLYRGQAVILLAAVSIPWFAQSLYLAGLSPMFGIDVVSVAFCIAALLLAVGFARLRASDVMSVSRAAILDSLADAVMVLDSDANMLYSNPSGAAFLERLGPEAVPEALARMWPQVFAARTGEPERLAEAQQSSWADASSIFDLSVSPIVEGGGHTAAKVLVVRDVTDLKHAEQALLSSLAAQQATIEGVIVALARTVDVRDPYTAGHQRRVSELGAAMALQIGLGEQRAEGVRVAGMLHDLGKITVPAEILSKPGPLTEMEFMLIKRHSQASFEILKTIHFPWPVAEMAVQHHERQDGTGYPQGLKGDEILPEARILAVADVVEAMASNRPYRAALGIEAALDEVRAGAGIRYEAAAVEACLRVFAEGFVFSEE